MSLARLDRFFKLTPSGRNLQRFVGVSSANDQGNNLEPRASDSKFQRHNCLPRPRFSHWRGRGNTKLNQRALAIGSPAAERAGNGLPHHKRIRCSRPPIRNFQAKFFESWTNDNGEEELTTLFVTLRQNHLDAEHTPPSTPTGHTHRYTSEPRLRRNSHT